MLAQEQIIDDSEKNVFTGKNSFVLINNNNKKENTIHKNISFII